MLKFNDANLLKPKKSHKLSGHDNISNCFMTTFSPHISQETKENDT